MLEKTIGIVLYSVPYSDKMSVVHLYTRAFGRMAYALPMRAGKQGARARSLYSPFSVLEMEVEHKIGRDIQRIQEARPYLLMQRLQSDPVKSAVTLFLAEFLARTIREPESNPIFFDFLVHSIEFFDLMEDGKANFHICFLIRLSGFLGFYPNADGYVDGYLFDLLNGVFVSGKPEHPYVLSPVESARFALLVRMDYHNLQAFRFSREERIEVLEKIIIYFRLHHAGFSELKSLEVLKSLFD